MPVCLSEEMVANLATCIRLNADCVDVCLATGNVLLRLTGATTDVVRSVVETCQVCAAECENHADMHDHCRICPEACRRCENACAELLASLS